MGGKSISLTVSAWLQKRQATAKRRIENTIATPRVKICMLIFNLENGQSSRNVRSYHYISRCAGTVPIKVKAEELAGKYRETVRARLDNKFNDCDNKSENLNKSTRRVR